MLFKLEFHTLLEDNIVDCYFYRVLRFLEIKILQREFRDYQIENLENLLYTFFIAGRLQIRCMHVHWRRNWCYSLCLDLEVSLVRVLR